jgi:glycosyltransferase involved in cell wall biosynthesis
MSCNILFISDNFYPETNAPASRTFEHCTEWVKQGHKVTVITCNPNFPFGKVYPDYKNRLIAKETLNGIEVVRLWSFIRPNTGFTLRILDHLSFAIIATLYSIFKSSDVIITTSPQFFTNFAGFFYKLIRRKPWVLELRDIWPESLKAVGSLSDGFIYNSLEKLELLFYRSANRIIVVTNSFKEQLTHRGIKSEKIHVIKNGVNTEFFSLSNTKESNIFPENKTIVGYVGTHGMAHNLDFILSASKLVKDDNYHFVFIGAGAHKEKLIKRKEEENLDNVSFYDNVSKEMVPSILSKLDYSIIHLKPVKTFTSVIPSKIFELAAMQVPILNGVEGETKEIIENAQIGVSYNPRDIHDFVKKLKELDSNKKLLAQISINQITFSNENSRQKRASEMLEYISNIS